MRAFWRCSHKATAQLPIEEAGHVRVNLGERRHNVFSDGWDRRDPEPTETYTGAALQPPLFCFSPPTIHSLTSLHTLAGQLNRDNLGQIIWWAVQPLLRPAEPKGPPAPIFQMPCGKGG